MIVRFVPHGQPLSLQFLSALTVNLESSVYLVELTIVLEDPAHVMEHSHHCHTNRHHRIHLPRKRLSPDLFIRPGLLYCRVNFSQLRLLCL